MFCVNCGQRLPNGAKFCFSCGTKVAINEAEEISHSTENVVPTPPDDSITFTIYNHELNFDSSYREYTKRRSEFLEAALPQALNEYNKLIKAVAESADVEKYDKIVDEIRDFGNLTFQEYIKIAHKFLLEQDIYTLTEASLLRQCGNTISNGSFFQKYNEIEEGYMKIVATDEELKEYRKLKKASRGYWQGGGFGVEGAIKGAITAGAMNAAGDVFHGIGDMIFSGVDDYKINKSKREFWNSKAWKRECFLAIMDDASLIFEEIYKIYADVKDVSIPPINCEKKNLYLSNAMALKDNAPKSFALYMMALQEYPFERTDYWNLLKYMGRIDHGVLQMMEFFLPPSFLDASTNAIHTVVLKRLAKCPEATYEDIDKKVKCLDQVIDKIKEEANISTACRAYIKTELSKADEIRENLLEKRMTADDGEKFKSVEELNQYLVDRTKFENYVANNTDELSFVEKKELLERCKNTIKSEKVLKKIEEEEEKLDFVINGDQNAKAELEKLNNPDTNITDCKDAVQSLKMLAEAGVCEAQYQTGKFFMHGLYKAGEFIVNTDRSEALKWFLLAAEQGDHRAQCNAAYIYEDSLTLTDYTRAIKLYEAAIGQGNTVAMVNLGVMYFKGKGVEKDYSKALELFNKAAQIDGSLGQEAAKGWITAINKENSCASQKTAISTHKKDTEETDADCLIEDRNKLCSIIDNAFQGDNVNYKSADEYSEGELKKILNQMTCRQEDITDIIALFDPIIKHALNGNYGGILFVETGFYFRQNDNSNLEYMRYSDILSVEEKFSTEVVHGQNGQTIRMKSISYAQRHVTDLFQYFADINSNQK